MRSNLSISIMLQEGGANMGDVMNEDRNYEKAVEVIKTAILRSQYDAARSVNEKQLMLYYGIGKYISLNSRRGFWGERCY